MFIGTFYHNLDAKNRVTVPRKILEKAREQDESIKLYMSMGIEKCLFLFKESRWNALTESLNGLSLGAEEARDFQRYFFSDTFEVEVDSAGRVLIPEELKKSALLNREVVFVGAGNRVEIWDADAWRTRKTEIAGRFANIAAQIL